MTSKTTNNIIVSYETDDVEVSFKIEFGKSENSTKCDDASVRTNYDNPYEIEHHIIDENKYAYCVLMEEGSFVLQMTDVNVVPKTTLIKRKIHNGHIIYNYGVTAVLDMNKEPTYSNPVGFMPSNNIERDGVPWVVHTNKKLRVDQNGEAMFQWSTARALEKGVKPTPEQEVMGVEERHENSGMIYLTFQPIYTEETHHTEEPTRGLTRGFTPSNAARVGYGSRAVTKSKKSSAIPIANSRYVLPIRIRNIGTASVDTKCAKDINSAIRVEDLQRKTGVLPDY
jgi:hypothetical protein